MSSEISAGINFFTQPPTFTKYLKVSLLTITLICLVVHGFIIVQTYLSYPTADNTYEYVEFEFPDVTLCHSARRSATRGKMFDKQVIEGRSFYKLFKRQTQFWSIYYKNNTNMSDDATERYRTVARKSIINHLSKHVAYKRPEDYVIHCTYQGIDCGFENFSMVYDPDWFYCSTFRPKRREMHEENDQAGLRLVLYGADSSSIMKSYEEYMHFLEGFRVIVHPPNTYPNSAKRATFVEVGSRVDIAVTREKRIKLNLKRQPCVTNATIKLNNFNIFPNTYKYSSDACTLIDRQETFSKKCRCISHKYPIPDIYVNVSLCYNVPYNPFAKGVIYNVINNGTIQINNETMNISVPFWDNSVVNWKQFRDQITCHDREARNMYKKQTHESLHCPNSCEQVTYSLNVFKRSWPSDRDYSLKYVSQSLHAVIKTNLAKDKKRHIIQSTIIENNKISSTDIQKNFMFLTVYPQCLTTQVVAQERSYLMGNLCSDFGGCLGLWIGWSIATVTWFVWELSLYIGTFKAEVEDEKVLKTKQKELSKNIQQSSSDNGQMELNNLNNQNHEQIPLTFDLS